MELRSVSLLFSLLPALLQLIKGQPQNIDACTSLDNLIANRINSSEVNCQRRPDCSGINCFSQNSFLRNFVDLFEFRLLPCAMPSPALRLQVLSREDAANNNQRTLVRNATLTNISSTAVLEVRSGGGDILFGTYNFSAYFSERNSSIGFAVELVQQPSGVSIWVVNYTVIPFDSAICSMPTTTTATTPAQQMQGTTTTMQPPSGSDDPRATNDSNIATPTAMNNDTLPLGTSRGAHTIPRVVLNVILVLLTMLVMTTLVV